MSLNAFKKNWPLWAGLLIFIVHFVLSYYGQWRYHYPIAPGDDIFNHLKLISDLELGQPTTLGGSHYPSGLHSLILFLGGLFGVGSITVTAWLWPALLVLSGLAIFVLAQQLFGLKVALVSYLLYALLSLQPLQTAFDGSLANLLAGNVILPLTILFWAKTWVSSGKSRLVWVVLSALGTVAIALTHHLTTVVLVAALSVSGLVVLVDRLKTQGCARGLVIRNTIIYLLIVGAAFAAFWFSPAATPVKDLLLAVEDISQAGKSWPIAAYFNRISFLIGLAGLAGLGYCSWAILRGRVDQRWRTGLLVILVWAWIYFLGSLTSEVGEPERLGRDLAMPISIIAGLSLSQLRLAWLGKAKYAVMVLLVIVALYDFSVKTKQLVRYNPMVRFSAADVELRDANFDSYIKPLYLWARNPAWNFLAKNEVATDKFTLVTHEQALTFLSQDTRSCVLASLYKEGTWPPDLQEEDKIFALEDLGATRAFILEDETKIWYSLCK
ncbi:MAG: hypothetical protein WEC83_02010 [Patescibacteria group bacterium]